MLNHSTRLKVLTILDDVIGTITRKPKSTYPQAQEDAIRGELYDAWDNQVRRLTRDLQPILNRITPPKKEEAKEILAIFHKHLSGKAITSQLNVKAAIRAVFDEATAAEEKHFVSVGGKLPKKKDGNNDNNQDAPLGSNPSFGIVFGLTESHAIAALDKFTTLSAGGFWDNEVSDSLQEILNDFFEGDTPRAELTDRLEKFVNDRLAIDGETSKPRAYFEGLAQHFVVQARVAGRIYKGKALGAIGYRPVNPDPKTDVCKTINGKFFPFDGAETELEAILSAESLDDLKAAAPFNAKEQSRNTPPYHWRCKTDIENVYAGLND